jgi:hypothetical protein
MLLGTTQNNCTRLKLPRGSSFGAELSGLRAVRFFIVVSSAVQWPRATFLSSRPHSPHFQLSSNPQRNGTL